MLEKLAGIESRYQELNDLLMLTREVLAAI
jgi:hypothetical protein